MAYSVHASVRQVADSVAPVRHPDSAARTIQSFSQDVAKSGALLKLSQEYAEICAADLKMPTKAMAANRAANRYMDVKCYDQGRVVLQTEPDYPSDYIHANWVDGYDIRRQFVCAQGPTAGTVGQFWRMIWQTQTVVIVSLTKLDGPRCMLYFPTTQGTEQQYADVVVSNRGVLHMNNFEAVTLYLTKDGVRRRCLQLTYYAWPDKGTPDSSTSLLAFINNINHNARELISEAVRTGGMSAGTVPPIVVHCSAGVGRTGTLVALHIVCRQLDVTYGKTSQGLVDVPGIVRALRQQRHMMVQRAEQYVFLYMATLDYALRKKYLQPNYVNVRPFFKDATNMARADKNEN